MDFPGSPVAKTACSQCSGPGQGNRSHMPQLRILLTTTKGACMSQQRLGGKKKIPRAAMKTQQSQINKYSVQFSSVAQSCPILCNPINHNTPWLLVHHQFPEFTQTHVHRVGDAIQPSHPLSSPSPAPNPSQHQSLIQ